MSWGTAWRNAWSGTWGDGISLTVAEAQHTETSDPCVLLQAHVLAVADARSVLAWPLTADTTIYTADNTSITADGSLVVLELIQANTLTLQDARNTHLVDVVPLSQVGSLSVYNASHNHAVDDLGYFVVPELRLLGTLSGQSGVVNVSGVQCVVFSGNNLYSQLPVLRVGSVTIASGQIAIQNSVFNYNTIDNNYLIIFYKSGSPRIGGGPYPARVVNIYA